MFLWTMVLPLTVIEKEGQAKPCAMAQHGLAQDVTAPTVVARDPVTEGLGSELPGLA
jgi:hypothetical protein